MHCHIAVLLLVGVPYVMSTWLTQAECVSQGGVGPDGKPLLGRISSKVGGLLDELADVLGAFEGIPAGEGEKSSLYLSTCSCLLPAAATRSSSLLLHSVHTLLHGI